MKLIFIYGPPASGKLTVAKELAKVTGYKVFHNQLTIDLVRSIFEWEHPSFRKFRDKYRLELMEEAARQKVKGLIFTYVYYKKEDDVFIKKIISRIEKHGGEIRFVQLKCDQKELAKRLKHPSRKIFSKIKSQKDLRARIKGHDMLSSFEHEHSLTVDNTKLSPKKTAKKIKEFYNL